MPTPLIHPLQTINASKIFQQVNPKTKKFTALTSLLLFEKSLHGKWLFLISLVALKILSLLTLHYGIQNKLIRQTTYVTPFHFTKIMSWIVVSLVIQLKTYPKIVKKLTCYLIRIVEWMNRRAFPKCTVVHPFILNHFHINVKMTNPPFLKHEHASTLMVHVYPYF